MSHPSTWLVAGPSGVGKTRWIAQQLQQHRDPVYIHLGGGSFPLDASLLVSECPHIRLLDGDRASLDLVSHQDAGRPIYLEVGFHVALNSLELPLTAVRNVAIVPPHSPGSEWSNWADETVSGLDVPGDLPEEMQRLVLTTEVLDPASLHIFWQELTLGAYGNVQRAKGIFNLADGQVFSFQYVRRGDENSDENNPENNSDYRPLNQPRTLDGRPQQFSGLEIVGSQLDRAAIAQTLQDSCLSDATLSQYQAYLQTETEVQSPTQSPQEVSP